MTKLNLENCNCILQESENREKYELNYMLGRMTIGDIVTSLADDGINTHSIIVQQHMARHIPIEIQEKVTEYLPSVSSTCAQLLSRVSSKAKLFLDKQVLEKDEIRLLGILTAESGKLLDKMGDITGETESINKPSGTVPDIFGKVCMEILPLYPDAWSAVRDKMQELDKVDNK